MLKKTEAEKKAERAERKELDILDCEVSKEQYEKIKEGKCNNCIRFDFLETGEKIFAKCGYRMIGKEIHSGVKNCSYCMDRI